ncbi:hypothetical protein C2G38_2172518 [Gigaspora rosea]|uniref:Uncharacterized protein n=1 Tax=Gigaspora rosea TaxID=44941 RepID=A0A397VM75_9GLOM|nr:hypothetical protein C2G38_2172518 [Gigaspora rosea]
MKEHETIIKYIFENNYLTKLYKLNNDSELKDKAMIALDKFKFDWSQYKEKTQFFINFWQDIQQSIAIHNALLGHLNVFGALLTQFARVLNESVKLPARRKYKDTTDTCGDKNLKKSKVNGQDSQLDNDNEQNKTNCTTNNNNYKKSSELQDNIEVDDDIKEINVDFMNISKELEHEQTTKCEVGCVNISDRFFDSIKEKSSRKWKEGSFSINLGALLTMSVPHLYKPRMESDNEH